MPAVDPLLERNRVFSATGAHLGLTPTPRHGVFVISCLDARVDPAGILGLELGDALVMRNAGGRVTDEVVEEIAFVGYVAERMLGDSAPPFEVVVIHHTECATGFLTDEEFRRSFAASINASEASLAERAVIDPAATVRADVECLRRSHRLPSRASVSGHVYDIGTGRVRTVVSASL